MDPMLVSVLPAVMQTFVVAFVASVCLFAVLGPDVFRWAICSRMHWHIRNLHAHPAPVSSEDNISSVSVQQQELGRRRRHERTNARQQLLLRQQRENNVFSTSDAATSLPSVRRHMRRAKRVSTHNHKEHYLVESATSHLPRPSAEPSQRQSCQTDGQALDCATTDMALRRDLSAAGFSVILEDTVPHLTRNVHGGQQGHAKHAMSAQSSD